MDELNEAVTIKAQVKSTISALKTLLKDKTLPKRARDMVDGMWADMTKTWDALAAELDGESPEPEPVLAKESELISEPIALIEATRGGVIPIKLIQPGWGSSGYYSEAMLKRDGPQVFKAGTHMYINHATEAERAARPEGDYRNLAAVLQTDARWDDNGKQGPGLYAEAKLFSDHAEGIRERAAHTGLSIRADGVAKQGEAAGRRGPIVEAITRGHSVDFVTMAGAGGAILSESRTAITPTAIDTEPLEVQQMMTEAEAKELSDLRAEVARFHEAAQLREAAGLITATLAEAKTLPTITRDRMTKQLANAGVFMDGKLDTVATKAIVEAAIKDEAEYLSNVTGAGRITGMGSGGAAVLDESKYDAEVTSLFTGMGLSKEAAELAAKRR